MMFKKVLVDWLLLLLSALSITLINIIMKRKIVRLKNQFAICILFNWSTRSTNEIESFQYSSLNSLINIFYFICLNKKVIINKKKKIT